jgi:hypothetical protein
VEREMTGVILKLFIPQNNLELNSKVQNSTAGFMRTAMGDSFQSFFTGSNETVHLHTWGCSTNSLALAAYLGLDSVLPAILDSGADIDLLGTSCGRHSLL